MLIIKQVLMQEQFVMEILVIEIQQVVHIIIMLVLLIGVYQHVQVIMGIK